MIGSRGVRIGLEGQTIGEKKCHWIVFEHKKRGKNKASHSNWPLCGRRLCDRVATRKGKKNSMFWGGKRFLCRGFVRSLFWEKGKGGGSNRPPPIEKGSVTRKELYKKKVGWTPRLQRYLPEKGGKKKKGCCRKRLRKTLRQKRTWGFFEGREFVYADRGGGHCLLKRQENSGGGWGRTGHFEKRH